MAFTLEKCPRCGEELQVPEKLENVICMFCGESFIVKRDKKPAKVAADEQSLINAMNRAYKNLDIHAIIIPQKDADVFTKITYPPSFEKYCEYFKASLDHFNEAFNLCPDTFKKEEIINEFGEYIANEIIKQLSGIKRKKMDAEFLYTRHIVAFVVPAILQYGAEFSDMLAQTIIDVWNSKYPKHSLASATFEQINEGFKRKGKFCFITTAVCQYMNKPDDCYELNSFRNFRDNWLNKQDGGQSQIAEYYLIAPFIIKQIDNSNLKSLEYNRIWEQYLSKCLCMIENKRYSECRNMYTDMVADLRIKWLSNKM